MENRTQTTNEIFVFGSNLAGRHGAGSAKEAVTKYGAIYGCGEGLQGKSYGIPTKDKNLNILPLPDIEKSVQRFIAFASARPNWMFNIVAIGCGLAGYKPEDIAPMFCASPPNCKLPEVFMKVLGKKAIQLSQRGFTP